MSVPTQTACYHMSQELPLADEKTENPRQVRSPEAKQLTRADLEEDARHPGRGGLQRSCRSEVFVPP